MADFSIRAFAPEDAPDLERMMACFLKEVEYKGRKARIDIVKDQAAEYAQKLQDIPNEWCLVAVNSSGAVGFTAYHLYNNGADQAIQRGDILVEKTYVDPEYRCKGIGTEFHKQRFNHVKELKSDYPQIRRLVSCIEDTNHRNIKLANKMGFRKISQGAYADRNLNYNYYVKKVFS